MKGRGAGGGPVAIHHLDICKWVQGVAETCRQQEPLRWRVTRNELVQDPEFVGSADVLHIFVTSV